KAAGGSRVVTEVVTSISKVSESALALTGTLNALGSHAEGIGKLMNIITDIADQTNLLALNAAIEAARAGDAVIAIQKGTQDSIASMQLSSQAVDQSMELARQAGASLQSILVVAESTAEEVRAIVGESEQQAQASGELNANTEEVQRIARETAERMAAAKEAVTEISLLVEEIRHVVETLTQ
ncbi:MAG: methyl-accepting chemotaxis protein, partial [Deltaproteobacteria bacterium]|nr:methyl-accepting chemotaxis protein [Deltaproteobacteria bacterium]